MKYFLISCSVFALQLFCSSCFHLFVLAPAFYIIGLPQRSLHVWLSLHTWQWVMERLLEALGERAEFIYCGFYSKVFWLCRFTRELPKSVCLGLISCSEWISQRRFYQFPSSRVICLLVCDLNAKRENKGKGLNTENLNFHVTPRFHYGTSSFSQYAVMFYRTKSLIFTFFG